MRTNDYSGKCADCGQQVGVGDGWVETVRDPETFAIDFVVRHNTCPPKGAAPRAELPRWGVYGVEGRTPAGNRAIGVAFVDGDKPEPGAVAVNDAARAIEAKS